MSFQVGSLYGVKLRVHFSLLIIFFLIIISLSIGYMPEQFPGLSQISYWIIGLISGLTLIISVILHELCHSIVANKLGLPVKRITLFFLGGAAELPEEPESAETEFKMAIAGPLFSFALALFLGGLWLIFKNGGFITELIAITQYGFTINFILAIFNMLPAFPLDGGRVFRSVLWKWKGNLIRATKLASRVSVGLSYVMMFGGFVMMVFGGFFSGLWMIIIGFFVMSGAQSGLSHTVIGQALSGTTVEDIMSRDVVTVDSDITINKLVEDYFMARKFAGYPVIKDGEVLGLVTMNEVKEIPRYRWMEAKVVSVMKPLADLVVVDPETPASDSMYKMSKKGVGRVLVMENGKLLGIVSRRDFTHVIKMRTELG